jgi:hypothetical protein
MDLQRGSSTVARPPRRRPGGRPRSDLGLDLGAVALARGLKLAGTDPRAPGTPARSRLADHQDDPHPQGRPVLHPLSLQLARRTVHLPRAPAPQRQLPLLSRDEQEREGPGRIALRSHPRRECAVVASGTACERGAHRVPGCRPDGRARAVGRSPAAASAIIHPLAPNTSSRSRSPARSVSSATRSAPASGSAADPTPIAVGASSCRWRHRQAATRRAAQCSPPPRARVARTCSALISPERCSSVSRAAPLFGVWWLDPTVGLLIAGVAVKEGLETWRDKAVA